MVAGLASESDARLAPLDGHDPRLLSTEWLFVAPISGLRLHQAVNKQFTVSRVTFVDREKVARVFRRMGGTLSSREIESQIVESSHYDAHDAHSFALLRHTGAPEESSKVCLGLVKEELNILAMSQLGFGRRRLNAHPALKGDQNSGRLSYLFLDPASRARVYSNQLTGKFMLLDLNDLWKRYSRETFFYTLLKIINRQVRVSQGWREILKRAAIMIGQSQTSNDIAQSFIWNMIVLEMLLTDQGERTSEVLPKRVAAFLGWVGFWGEADYEERIKDVYQKRCKFVHGGQAKAIEISDLLFTDDLLLNLLVNLVSHYRIFSSRKVVREFADKVEAEHVLGIRPKVRPRTLRFFSRSYTNEDLQEI